MRIADVEKKNKEIESEYLELQDMYRNLKYTNGENEKLCDDSQDMVS